MISIHKSLFSMAKSLTMFQISHHASFSLGYKLDSDTTIRKWQLKASYDDVRELHSPNLFIKKIARHQTHYEILAELLNSIIGVS